MFLEKIQIAFFSFLLCVSSPIFAEGEDKLYVVLSMHRSGSSVITKGLSTLGLNLGNRCFKVGLDNPQGYFEDEDIRDFNEEILLKAGLECHSVRNFPNHVDQEEDLVYQGQKLIEEKISKFPSFCFKDPRTARNMRIWRCIFKALNLEPVFIIIVRNPYSVALSLKKRNNLDLIRTFYMWYQHYRSALEYTKEYKRYFIAYEDFVMNPKLELNRLSKEMSLQEKVLVEKQLEFLSSHVQQRMQHFSFDKGLVSLLPLEIRELYLQLLCSNREALINKTLENGYLEEVKEILDQLDEMDQIGLISKQGE